MKEKKSALFMLVLMLEKQNKTLRVLRFWKRFQLKAMG
jgi:hypothetical protein